jgi:hypothetical protein
MIKVCSHAREAAMANLKASETVAYHRTRLVQIHGGESSFIMRVVSNAVPAGSFARRRGLNKMEVSSPRQNRQEMILFLCFGGVRWRITAYCVV